MRILVACEYSSRVSGAFRVLGHDAWSCDLLPSEGDPSFHLQEDVIGVLDRDWDMLIAHPDCTYVCSSGAHWNGRIPGREEKTIAAMTEPRTWAERYPQEQSPIGENDDHL